MLFMCPSRVVRRLETGNRFTGQNARGTEGQNDFFIALFDGSFNEEIKKRGENGSIS